MPNIEILDQQTIDKIAAGEGVTRSSTLRILLVEWRKKARGTCSCAIPHPLSVMRIKEIPPSLISTVTALASASMAFSTNSFTTDILYVLLRRLNIVKFTQE